MASSKGPRPLMGSLRGTSMVIWVLSPYRLHSIPTLRNKMLADDPLAQPRDISLSEGSDLWLPIQMEEAVPWSDR